MYQKIQFKQNQFDPPPKYSKGKLLAVLGTLAIGSTIAASFYNKETPKSAFEPNESGDKPEFAEGKVSVILCWVDQDLERVPNPIN